MNKQTWGYQPVKFEPIAEWQKVCLIKLDVFKTWLENQYVGYDDGYGYYATETEASNIFVDFDDIMENNLEDWVTHVIWLNK